MAPTRDDVFALVRRFFPKIDVAVAMQTLDDYGTQANEPERERVQLAILGLSQSDPLKLRYFVEAAKRDYRDVLSWSDDAPEHVASLIEVLRANWSWAFSNPIRVIERNRFGNLLVQIGDGSIWRVCPEDLAASQVAPSEADLETVWADEEFQADWESEAWIDAAETALGRLGQGQCYGFKMWPVLGAPYDVENMVIKLMVDWLAASGDVGRQVKDLPDGTQVRFDVRE
jgi:hypothetical protein